jgi:hypothetical protein
MDNMHEPPSGDPQDLWPTQEVSQGPRLVGPEQGWTPPPPPRPQARQAAPTPPPRATPRRRSKALWWGAGLAVVLLMAGGGAAAAALTSSNAPAPTALTGQAAQLNTLLNSNSGQTSNTASTTATNSTGTTTPCLNRAKKLEAKGHSFAAQAVLRLCGHPLRRLRLLGGMHGEFTFETKTGPRTIAFERGVIQSVSNGHVVVQAKDGTTWTWDLESNTVIRQGGKLASASALSDGEHVFAGGPVVSGGYDARLIVVKPSSGSSSPSPAPSPTSSPTSGS